LQRTFVKCPAHSQVDERATAWRLEARPEHCKLADRPKLRDIAAEKLAHRWSPQQIAGWVKTAYPDDREMQEPEAPPLPYAPLTSRLAT
jgi:IS30 family transposase